MLLKWLLMFSLCLATSMSADAETQSRRKKKKRGTAPTVQFKKVASCEKSDSPQKVLILKQWHLSPTTVTKGFKEKYPHEQNQAALYKFLAEAVRSQTLQLVIGEGCEGEINADFKPVFNGWDFTSLKAQSQQKNYSKIVSHVPLKLEARFGSQINTQCGDNEALIQEGNLRISNLRGWMGFLSRLSEEQKDLERKKLYVETAADLLKLPRDTAAPKLIDAIKDRIKQDVEAFRKSLSERNEFFVKALAPHEFETAAIVIGGLHWQDLKDKIQAAKLNCEVYQPPGYQASDERLLEEFQKSL